MKTTPITLTALALLLGAAGCAKNETTSPPAVAETTAAEYLARGWSSFGAGGYTAARTNFDSAIARDASLADAHNGRGWCQGILGGPAPALEAFRLGLAQPGTAGVHGEIKAGMAFAHAASDRPDSAILRAAEVLLADSQWRFSHSYRPSRDYVLNYLELCLLLAQSHFKLGQFSTAEDYVQLLHPGFEVDEATPSGQAQLQAEIERLATQF